MNWWQVVGVAGLVLVGIGLTWTRWATATLALMRRRAGYVRHSIGVDGFELVYHESGRRNAPPMLLLHGFGGDGDNWVRFTPHMRGDYRVLVPDLPGFGQTGYLPGQSYSLERQIARLKDFVDMLHLEQVHLVGNSMGGYIAAGFAAAYPERVASLGLFNAAGVDMPKRSPFYDAALEGENWLLVREPSDFDRIIKLVYHKQPWIPGFLRDFLVAQRMSVADDQDLVFHEIFTERVWLDDRLPAIKAPTLILWGDDDRVLDISSIKLFQAGIRHAQVAIIPACGHVPMLEKPAATARVYRGFLANQGDKVSPAMHIGAPGTSTA
ncbi:lipase [Chitinimonas prasina]|uniref:Lipase n=1 Tax=Chitinimonas prasina TaxID=1434937 RepID=A0ABQ5YBP5_9NEIS|nr:alpha/beta fold hydrolase [Chitinimonas prasina]GLR12365.1 lipase [Chitinimonas prasina]